MVTYTDQQIRDKGILYLPKQEYLQDPYQFSVAPVPPPASGGITNTNAFANSGNDFSVYNPDPNSIVNRTYNPRPYYDATYEDTFGTNLGDPEALTATGARFAEPNTKMSGILNMMPGAGIARFLGNQIGPYIPPNRRAIMENQLSGQGIMVNDIGQIVQGQGDYDTAANVMAGYNANQLTAKSFDDRIEMADNKMSAENKGARIKALKEAKAAWEKATGRSDTIYDFEEEEKKKKKKDTVVGRYLTERKEKKAAKKTAAADETSAQNYPTGGSYDAPGGVTDSNYNQAANERGGGGGNTATNSQGQTAREATYDGNKNTGTSQGYSQHYADGGRAGYFFGGRVNYKAGGRINFRGGGMDASSDDFGSGDTPGPGDTGGEGGNNPSDGSDTQFGGGNNDGASDNRPVTVVNNNPIDISTVTKSVGDYDIPYGVEALMANKGRFKAVINPDDILDKNLGAEFTYDNGPFSIGAYADMDGDKSLNANYTRNNSNYSFDLNDDGGQLKFTRTFAN